jgi:hypothetical protein
MAVDRLVGNCRQRFSRTSARHNNRVKHSHLRSGFKLLGPNSELTLGAAIYGHRLWAQILGGV